MKQFLKYSIASFLGVFILLSLLDVIYTSTYVSAFPRNKTQYILNLEQGTAINYVFLGSSRVENTIMASVIEDKTKKKALNLGTQGARLNDANIFLRLLIDKNIKIERLFIQVDYIYNSEASSDLVRAQALPFIRRNTIINNYVKRVDPNYKKNYYIPFYRYAVNDYRLGFREFFASLIKKPSKTDFEDGFVPAFGTIQDIESVKSGLPKTIIGSNKHIKEIDSLCRKHNIKITYFCAPYCSKVVTNNYLTKLSEKLSDFKDFSSVVKEDNMFKDCGHLNDKGARNFTEFLIDSLYL